MYHWVCLCESVGNKLILEDALLEIQRTQVNKIIWCYHMVKRVTEQRKKEMLFSLLVNVKIGHKLNHVNLSVLLIS